MYTPDESSRRLGGRSLTISRAVGAFLTALVGLQALLQAGLAGAEIQVTLNEDEATIVASGRSAMPSDPVAWRVVRDTALAASDSVFKERALGFAIADQSEIELIGDGIGPTVEIEPDGAGFIPEAVHQIHVSPSGQPTSYLRIGLVPPVDAEFTAGGELVYPGDGFAAPGGERELLLVRHRLSEGSEFPLAAFGVPTLLVVTRGEVAVDGDEGLVFLGQSEARAFWGEPTVTATADGETLVYVAIVGGEVGSPPGYEGAPGTGEVWAFAHGCPSGMPTPPQPEDIEAYFNSCGEPLEGTPFILTHDGGQEYQDSQIDIAAPGQSLAVWRDVPAGQISIGAGSVAGYGPPVVYCLIGEGMYSYLPVEVLTFELQEEQRLNCHFFFQSVEDFGGDGGQPVPTDETGSIAVQIFQCPAGIDSSELPAAQQDCALDNGAIELNLFSSAWEEPLNSDEMVTRQSSIAWVDLPLGDYTVAYSPPNGGEMLSASDPDALGPQHPNTNEAYPVTISPGNPDIVLQIYLFT